MFMKMHKRLSEKEDGFTLIELMVVVLIIAILIAIAIPTFLGARKRAQDRAAQSSLRNSLTAAATIYTDAEDYTDATPAALLASEPSLTFAATAATDSTGFKNVSVASTVSQVAMAALSKSGTCFYIKDIKTGGSAGTTYGSLESGAATCSGDDAAAASMTGSW
jgi:type IV pilus assembly protein PilA